MRGRGQPRSAGWKTTITTSWPSPTRPFLPPCWKYPTHRWRCSWPVTPAWPGAPPWPWSAAARRRRVVARWRPVLPAASSRPGWR
ncbi:hypothetical protein G6F54_014442 [Rhizopus delemar]|nr:hypothetical protein G6F54_014442 [Rhizopus delemar]